MNCKLRLPVAERVWKSLLLLCLVTAPAEAQTLLRWKFAPGQSYNVAFRQETTTETTGAGKPTGVSISMEMQMAWAVNAIDNGVAETTQQFDRLKITMKSGAGEPIEYDSDAAEPPRGDAATLATGVQPLLGAKFNVSMTDRGEIRSVTLPEETSEALKTVSSATLQQLFSAQGISKVLRQSAMELPEHEVKPGDRWSREGEIQTPLGLLAQTHMFQFAGTEDLDGRQLDKIAVTTTLKIKQPEDSPAKLKLVDHDQTGALLFDAESGHVASSESTQKLTTERQYREFTIKVVTTNRSTMVITLATPE